MSDFIAACTHSPVNLVLSLLLMVTLLYWSVVILGAAGLDSLDFDLDLEGDGGLDAGADAGLLSAGLGASILKFFHVGTVPVLVLWSVFILCLWAVGVLAWPLLGRYGVLLQIAALLPLGLGALLLTKALTLPLKAVFDRIEKQAAEENHLRLVGRRCVIASLTVDHRQGQAEIPTGGAPLRLHVRTRDPGIVLNKGDEAVLVAEDKAQRVYYVQRF